MDELDRFLDEENARACGYAPESLAMRMNRVNHKKIKKLERENKKMREYLELIVNTEYSFSGSATRQLAQECLKELEAGQCGSY